MANGSNLSIPAVRGDIIDAITYPINSHQRLYAHRFSDFCRFCLLMANQRLQRTAND